MTTNMSLDGTAADSVGFIPPEQAPYSQEAVQNQTQAAVSAHGEALQIPPQKSSAKPAQKAAGLSAFGKAWKMPPENAPSVYQHLLDLVDNSTVLAKLLYQRGFGDRETALAFLQPENYTPTKPHELPDVDKAIQRISEAITKNQNITVYGDYDVDGVTGTSVLLTVLRKLGASVDFYIPNRANEGYGLNLKAVTVLASKHRTKLIITCDCGVSNFAEVNLAKTLGVDTLILDHHSMPEMLPPAVGIVHPKRLASDHPLYELPGVGVAYKVCEALLLDKGMPEEVEPLLDFVTLGMIADLVPLVKENRYLVQVGLPKLISTKRAGLQALMKQVHKSEDTDLVGFGLAPRINAVGRLSEAKAAVELMTTDDAVVAENLARQLQTENIKRQELCDRIFAEADRVVQQKKLDSKGAIAIYDRGWHHGVVGIVASRLVERYHKPVFIGEFEEAEGVIRGSARGVEGMDLYQALKQNEALLTRWGGHKMAAGFTVEAAKGDTFCSAIASTCAKLLANTPANPQIQIDLTVEAEEVTQDLARQLMKLAPYGMANKKPLLHVTNLRCLETRVLGREAKHHRITARSVDSESYFEAVLWNSRNRVPALDEEIEMVFTPEINSFNGRERLQLVLADWRSVNQMNQMNQMNQTNQTHQNNEINQNNEIDRKSVDQTLEDASANESQPDSNQPPPGSAVPQNELDFSPENEANMPSLASTGRTVAASEQKIADRQQASRIDAVPAAIQSGNPQPDQTELPVPQSQANHQQTGADGDSQGSTQIKDLRSFSDSPDMVAKARQKFGSALQVFAEPTGTFKETHDRTTLTRSTHLMLLTLPPTQKVFQEMVAKVSPEVVYIVGQKSDTNAQDAAAFLKRLYGLVKYAVNQKDGQVEGEKLAALMASSKMALALGLTVLRKCHVIDWFAEDGILFLDMLGEPGSISEDLPEYKQLATALSQTSEFREWCRTADAAELDRLLDTDI